jgi:hypothetical protein
LRCRTFGSFILCLRDRGKAHIFLGKETFEKTKSGEETLRVVVDELTKQIKDTLPEYFENHFEMQTRAKAARKYIVEEIMRLEKQLGRPIEKDELIVVSHSSFLKQLTSINFD